MTLGTLYFLPRPPSDFPLILDPHTAEKIFGLFFGTLCFVNYVLFSVLTLYGIQVAYRLRHGEARYAENYKLGIQKQIDRLVKRFPKLML